jgi:hypothetical protein
MMAKLGEPPRSVLMRHLFWLLGKTDVGDRHIWARQALNNGNPVTSFKLLTTEELHTLIDKLVLLTGIARACRSLGSDEQACIHEWPGHPLWCCDVDGTEWIAKEI